MSRSAPRQVPIAVTGLGALFPGATDHESFWRNIFDGKDLIQETPPTHWLLEDYYDPDPSKPGKTYGKRGGFLPDVSFDPLDHAIPPNNLSATDTAQLLALIVAKRVLHDACRLDFSRIDPTRASVILGVASATELTGTMSGSLQYPLWRNAMLAAGLSEAQAYRTVANAQSLYADWNENTFPGLLGNVVAGRIASRFGLGGTNCVIDAACASSLGAIHLAVQELSLGHSDLVITGGVDALNDVFMFICFSRTPALSPTGDCRPFSENADGTVLGEGVGMLALRRLEDAERDGDRIYAVLRGVGSSSDGRAKSIYAPRPEGQALALERAYRSGGYGPESVELVEAHGTGTVAGDLAELEALVEVFDRSGRKDGPWCALGSVKSQIGHTKGAAGAASLIKTVLALHQKVLPPTIKVSAPHPNLRANDTPFYVNTTPRPWIRGARHPRRASVSSFGFGGSNFHVTLEEYRGGASPRGRIRHLSSELFLFSGSAAADLRAAIQTASVEAEKSGGFSLAAQHTQSRFDRTAPHRLAIVASSPTELRSVAARFEASNGNQSLAQPGLHYAGGEPKVGPIAFLFPGQGSQYVGMGAELAMAFELARQSWDEVVDSDDAALALLPRIVFPAPAFSDDERRVQQAELTRTSRAQPAIALSSLCYLNLLTEAGVKPDSCGGHSFGELTALHAAGAMSREQFLTLSVLRGEILEAASRDSNGAMLAVFASREVVSSASAIKTGRAVIANHNAPEQVVVAGVQDAIEDAAKEFAAQGLESRRIQVATAFHSPLVASAASSFRAALTSRSFSAPAMPVFANATARPYPSSHEAIAELLATQIVQEVQFAEQIEAMYADGARIFVEVGPNAILTELVARCLKDRPHLAIALDGKARDGVWRFWNALGQLAVAGVPLEFASFWNGFELEAPNVEPKSPASVDINGSNFGKRYPAMRKPPAASPPDTAMPQLRSEIVPPPQNEGAPSTSPRIGEAPRSWAASPSPREPMPQPATPPTPALPPQDGEDLRRRGLIEIVRHSSEAHQVAQKALADTHLAYLSATEAALRLLAGGDVERLSPLSGARPSPMSAPQQEPNQFTPPAPAPADPTPRVMAPPNRNPVKPIVGAEPPAAPPSPETPPRDMTALLLDIVAAKTGYPASMLTADMELERDLGIDSIKRVEILAAVRQAVPGLHAVDPNELAGLTSLRAIGERLGVPSRGASSPPAASEKMAAKRDVAEMLLEIVAEKTGYPVSMLRPEMELERDLGVDSIKRVEILAAARKALPDLPQVDPNELAKLTTLAAIGERLRDAQSSPAPRSTTAAKSSTSQDNVISRLILEAREAPRPSATRRPHCVAVQDNRLAEAIISALAQKDIPAERFFDIPSPQADAVMLFALDEIDPSATAQRALDGARAFARRASEDGGLLMTVQDTGGDFGLSGRCGQSAWRGGLPGLVKTAAREWPKCRTKAIDLDCSGRSSIAIAETLVEELLCAEEEIEIGLPASGRRLTLQTVERALSEVPSQFATLPEEPVLVVTGARGVTAACAGALARRRRARLAFLGRTQLLETPAEFESLDEMGLRAALAAQSRQTAPDLRRIAEEARRLHASNETRRTLRDLAGLGIETLYQSVDVSDGPAVRVALDDIRARWGRIDGVIHGAGVLADKLIESTTPEQFRAVFDPKVGGLRALLDATAQDELSLIVLFSSIAGRFGNAGQSAYAMANEILNKVARAEAARRGPSCLVRALNWGPWSGGMVTPELQRHFAERNIATIDLNEGAEAFVAEILHASRDLAEVEVILCGAPSATANLG
ncbi:MAG: SDR family oxidoreductase [Methylocystis sp.]